MTGTEKHLCTVVRCTTNLPEKKEKVNKRKNWYGKGGHETVMFVDSTPGSKLAKEFRQILDSCGLKIRVVERTGESIKNLIRSIPDEEVPSIFMRDMHLLSKDFLQNARLGLQNYL